MSAWRRGCGAALLVAGVLGWSVAGDGAAWHLPAFHGGTLRARDLARQGTEALQRKDDAAAARLLAESLHEDPSLVPSWINLAAVEIRRCRKDAALFAASIARRLAPDDAPSAENLKLASTMECPASPDDAPLARAERNAYASAEPAAWIEAAALRRASNDRAHAVLYEDIALHGGGERAPALRRIASDLRELGCWRAAALALTEAGSAPDLAEARQLDAALDARAADVERAVAPLALPAGDERIAGRARMLAEIALARGGSVEAATRAAAQVAPALQPTRASGWWGAVSLDPAWSEVQQPDGEGVLVLRRAPGDTQLVIAAWPAAEGEHDAALARALGALGAAPAGPLAPCPRPPSGAECRVAPVDIAAGFEGSARMSAYAIGPAGQQPWLLAVALAGDAGAGTAGRRAGAKALEDTLAALELPAAAPGPAEHRLRLPIPSGWQADRVHDEARDPWRRAPLGAGLALDLPPGIVGGTLPEPGQSASGPDTRLLLRGRFTDLDGTKVAIGDLEWPGWVAVQHDGAAALAARRAEPARFGPRSDPAARFVRSADLGPVFALAGSGNSGLAARFGGGRFGGTWLLFWIACGGDLVELALPVVEGAGSASVAWGAITVRREADAGPPPPVDFTARYSVRFTRTAGRESGADPREGRLEAAELQLSVPRGFRVSLNPASPDGLPVVLRGPDGASITVERLAPLAISAELRRADVESRRGPPNTAWKSLPAQRGLRIDGAAFGETDAARVVVLLVLPDPPAARAAFRLSFEGASLTAAAGEPVRRLVSNSVRLK